MCHEAYDSSSNLHGAVVINEVHNLKTKLYFCNVNVVSLSLLHTRVSPSSLLPLTQVLSKLHTCFTQQTCCLFLIKALEFIDFKYITLQGKHTQSPSLMELGVSPTAIK